MRAASGELASLGPLQSSIRAISIGPNQSTTAFTELLTEVYSPISPSISTVFSPTVNSLTEFDVPANDARCPPEEKPVMPMNEGSILYLSAFALTNLIAALTSLIWAG